MSRECSYIPPGRKFVYSFLSSTNAHLFGKSKEVLLRARGVPSEGNTQLECVEVATKTVIPELGEQRQELKASLGCSSGYMRHSASKET